MSKIIVVKNFLKLSDKRITFKALVMPFDRHMEASLAVME